MHLLLFSQTLWIFNSLEHLLFLQPTFLFINANSEVIRDSGFALITEVLNAFLPTPHEPS